MVGFRDGKKSLEEDLEDAAEQGKDGNYMGSLTQQDLMDKTVDRGDDDDDEEMLFMRGGDEGGGRLPIVLFANGTVDVVAREGQSIMVANKAVATRTQVECYS